MVSAAKTPAAEAIATAVSAVLLPSVYKLRSILVCTLAHLCLPTCENICNSYNLTRCLHRMPHRGFVVACGNATTEQEVSMVAQTCAQPKVELAHLPTYH